jgi:hypothetical protein
MDCGIGIHYDSRGGVRATGPLPERRGESESMADYANPDVLVTTD